MKKKQKNQLVSSLKSFLLLLIVSLLIWFKEDSLIDAISLPKTLVYVTFTSFFCALCYKNIISGLQKNRKLLLICILFSLPFIVDLPTIDNFYGESQRLNGTLMFTVITLSTIFGWTIAQEKRIEELLRYFNLNSLIVSCLLVMSKFLTLNGSIIVAWTRPSAQGGINENFKSLFLAFSTVLLCATLPRSLSAVKRKKFKLFSLALNIVAMVLVGSLQGFIFLLLCGAIFALSSQSRLRAVVPVLSFAFLAGYCLAIFNRSVFDYFDSSTQERIKLSQRAIELLESAPLITPHATRISESDFSQAIMTSFPGKIAWIDDVHNFYLNVANTFGIFIAVSLIVISIVLILDYTKYCQILSFEAKWFGALLISIALVLNITIMHIVYLPIVFIILGSYVALRVGEKERWVRRWTLSADAIKPEFHYSALLPALVSATILIQLGIGIVQLSREYVLQKQVSSFYATTSSFSTNEFQKFVLPRVRKSQDLRFIYEIGRARHLQKDCYGVRVTLDVMNSRSTNHFLTKQLSRLSEDCSASR